MKTISINLYQFDELSEEAKQNAIDHFRESELFYTPFYVDEANNTLEKFCDIFSIKYRSIDYLEPYRNDYSIHLDDNILALTGQRLANYIWNNHKKDIFKGKYYGKLVKTFKDGSPIEVSKEHPAGMRHIKRYSKILLDNSCVLTGVCYDQDVLDPIYKFLEHPKELTIEELIDRCIKNLCKSVRSEYEYQTSNEGLTEYINNNDYWFTIDGELS
jgi:hypothetical protein